MNREIDSSEKDALRGPDSRRPYIDVHCHIYPDAIAHKAAAGIDSFYGGLPGEHADGTVDTLLALGRRAGMIHYIVHSAATRPGQVHNINSFIANTAAEHPEFTGFGTLHPDSDELDEDVRELLSLGLRGIKLHPDVQGFDADSDKAMRIYEACERHGLFVLMHCGDCRLDRSGPDRIINIMETFPKLKLIAAHFGGYTVWDEALNKLPGRFEDLFVDCSSTTLYIEPEKVVRLIRAFGAGRVLFGSDYPMVIPGQEIARFEALDISEEEKDMIGFGNAAALFGIAIE